MSTLVSIQKSTEWYDRTLLLCVFVLAALGMIMVTSSSLFYAENSLNGKTD